ncbi:unnamed protein product [Adineta ricciae]|uniref:Sorting nexin n=1 Tax=Adineta ricciae TaxID=249248 RepID=A0A814TJG6_ADIRI|nr:unnamed protein product [Adineta ricciae]
MNTYEFQARALYDFIAESSNELTFYANEILTITSAADGQAWWYARNTAGQEGAIPANYIEVITDTTEPPADQTPHSTVNPTPVTNLDDQPPAQSKYEQQTQQHTNLTDDMNWFNNDQVAPVSDQHNITMERQNEFDSSFDSVSSPSINENSSHQISDPYMTTVDAPSSVVNPFVAYNAIPNQQELLYSNYTESSIAISPENPPASSNLLSPFAYPQSTIPPQQQYEPPEQHYQIPQQQYETPEQQQYQVPQQRYEPPEQQYPTSQQNVYAGQFAFPPTTQNEPVYEPPPSIPTSRTSTETNVHGAPPVPVNHSTPLTSPVSPTLLKSSVSVAPSPSGKTKQDNRGFFTLRRQKTKSEQEKRQSLVEVRSEPTQPSPRDDSDSDLTESGSSAHNQKKQRIFFDKFGIDNYILHGCKIKVEEHVDITYDEKDGGVYWSNNPHIPPFSCKVEDPAKGTKLGGLKSFMEYKVHAQIPGSRVVGRRYKQFDWLHEQLITKFRFICVPPLPGKQIAGRFENEFIEERRRQLELWLNRICRHPVLCASFPVQHFVTCELTEKNNKDWKAGKRRSEKDELRDALWLHCVTFTNSNLTDAQIATQVDVFAQQQPAFETHLRNLHQGLTKYLERHTEIYERDMQRLGELFSKLFMAMQIDTATAGNKELSSSMSKIGVAFNGIGELYKTKSSEGIRDFNERIIDYIGILSCFPAILMVQRSASECIRNVQQRGLTGTPDFAGAIHRSQILNHVILAEINFFQREKVYDFNTYLKQLLHEQIMFYENITEKLRETAAAFN